MNKKQKTASLSIEDIEVYLNQALALLQAKVQPYQREIAGFSLLLGSILALFYLIGLSGAFFRRLLAAGPKVCLAGGLFR